MIEKKIETSNRVSLNFNSIRNEVRENVHHSTPNIKSKQNVMPKLKLLVLTIIMCLITVVVSVNVTKATYSDSNKNSTESYIGDKLSDEKYREIFDTFVAFGNEKVGRYYGNNVLLNLDLISTKDKEVLIKYFEENESTVNDKYTIHLGIKEGKDIVYIESKNNNEIYFIFNSNLDYSFESVINNFEVMCNQELTQDILKSTSVHGVLSLYTSGIFMRLKEVDGIYVIYYSLRIDNKLYILNK